MDLDFILLIVGALLALAAIVLFFMKRALVSKFVVGVLFSVGGLAFGVGAILYVKNNPNLLGNSTGSSGSTLCAIGVDCFCCRGEQSGDLFVDCNPDCSSGTEKSSPASGCEQEVYRCIR